MLIVTSEYSGPRGAPWLMDDLVEELVRQGHQASVLAIDTKRPWPKGDNGEVTPGVSLFSAGPQKVRRGILGKLSSQFIVAFRLHTEAFSWARSEAFDLIIFTSIGLFSWFFPRRLRRRGAVSISAIVLWDFFPIHHQQIGRLGRGAPLRLLKWLERFSLQGTDAVVLMTPKNVEFFRGYHQSFPGEVGVAAPWSSVDPIHKDFAGAAGRGRDRVDFHLVWAGQMIEGRGLDLLLRVLGRLEVEFTELRLTLVGDGPRRSGLESLASALSLKSVEFVGRLPRSSYRDILTTADAGIAITIPGVTIPTFSAKISEFCAYGVPVIVSIEASSDAGKIVEEAGAGLACLAGDEFALESALRQMIEFKRSGQIDAFATAARSLYERELSVEFAVRTLVETVSRALPSG